MEQPSNQWFCAICNDANQWDLEHDLEEEGRCIYSGKPSHRRVVFARSY